MKLVLPRKPARSFFFSRYSRACAVRRRNSASRSLHHVASRNNSEMWIAKLLEGHSRDNFLNYWNEIYFSRTFALHTMLSNLFSKVPPRVFRYDKKISSLKSWLIYTIKYLHYYLIILHFFMFANKSKEKKRSKIIRSNFGTRNLDFHKKSIHVCARISCKV